jgi:hypothetical protein
MKVKSHLFSSAGGKKNADITNQLNYYHIMELIDQLAFKPILDEWRLMEFCTKHVVKARRN